MCNGEASLVLVLVCVSEANRGGRNGVATFLHTCLQTHFREGSETAASRAALAASPSILLVSSC